MTSLVFGGLTAYVLISRADFSFMGGFLTVALFSMLGLIVISLFFQSHLLSTLISVGIIALFALYVLFDTSRIMLRLGPDEWAAGALNLFIDFINMFLNILFLMTGGRRD
jgi:FtsH-binding integral membrane protein